MVKHPTVVKRYWVKGWLCFSDAEINLSKACKTDLFIPIFIFYFTLYIRFSRESDLLLILCHFRMHCFCNKMILNMVLNMIETYFQHSTHSKCLCKDELMSFADLLHVLSSWTFWIIETKFFFKKIFLFNYTIWDNCTKIVNFCKTWKSLKNIILYLTCF